MICAQCGVTVWREPRQLKASPNRFCSRPCRARFYLDAKKTQAVLTERWKATFTERFWARVNRTEPNECWEWQGSRMPQGHGQVGFNGKVMLTHRVALSLIDGNWDSPLLVCHRCDNPPCCNPSHLYRGTHQDNANDSWGKGTRKAKMGEECFSSKLTEQQVIYIRTSQKPGTELARELGVHNTTIYDIKNRVKWKHVA